jgi:hypothetical protein
MSSCASPNQHSRAASCPHGSSPCSGWKTRRAPMITLSACPVLTLGGQTCMMWRICPRCSLGRSRTSSRSTRTSIRRGTLSCTDRMTGLRGAGYARRGAGSLRSVRHHMTGGSRMDTASFRHLAAATSRVVVPLGAGREESADVAKLHAKRVDVVPVERRRGIGDEPLGTCETPAPRRGPRRQGASPA